MADIFISYAQSDRDKVLMLSAYLESEGWTVWWDTRLGAGDTFRDEIMKQLAAARAVIVLWTPNSIKSDFVRAEAGRAKADGKLIPVKTADVAYADIPLPFGEMHTEDLSKRELIRAAVVAQLAKPQVQPSALWVASRTLRYQALTWVGIVGGAITLFTNLRGVLDLADWAKWLVTNWHDWSLAFWAWSLGWIGITLPRGFSSVLSFVAFSLSAALGARVHAGAPSRPKWRKPSKSLLYQSLLCILGLIGAGILFGTYGMELSALDSRVIWSTAFIAALMAISMLSVYYFGIAEAYAFQALILLFTAVLIGPEFWTLTRFFGNLTDNAVVEGQDRLYSIGNGLYILLGFGLGIFVPCLMVTVARVDTLTRRLSFATLGMLVLMGLNQLSIYAPYIRDLLKPAT